MNVWAESVSIARGAAADGRLNATLDAVARLDRADVAWPAAAAVRVLRNFAAEAIGPFVKLAGYRRGVRIDVQFADYDNLEQEILDPASPLPRERHDLIVVALWLDGLARAFDVEGRFQGEAVGEHLFALFDRLRERTSCPLAIHTFLPPAHAGHQWSGAAELRELNRRLRERFEADERFVTIDLERLLIDAGGDEAIDRRFGYMHQAPLTARLCERWGDALAQAAASARGLTRKVLVLDADDTMWGGVVGEDGLEGIRLEPHEYPGNAFFDFQRQILDLQRSGVLLALCSKNNEADVLDVLDRHPHCLLRRRHFAAWRINWQDKATNLRELSAELNLGLESFVFIDDSPTERGLVRGELPMVETLDLPEKPYEIPSLLRRYSGFRRLQSTREDQLRTEQYQAERARRASAPADLEAYLSSLELAATIGPATADQLPRVAQLTQKTNQFNLTTRRYSLGEIEECSRREQQLVLALSVVDRFGDYGLTGAAILRADEEAIDLDAFLMSCRILGRRLEHVFLREVVERARQKWPDRPLRAEYRRSAKNSQVERFYDARGFELDSQSDDVRRYRLVALQSPSEQERTDFIQVFRR